jgi:general secretion pathway protein I
MWSWTGSRARPRSSSSARGFTLIEVLVAFAILALTLAALMQVFAAGLRSSDAVDRHLMATMLARSVMDDLGAEIPIAAGERSGEIEQGYRWTVRIQPSATIPSVAIAEWMQTPYEIQVEVTWNDRPIMRLTTLRVVAEPTSMPNATGDAMWPGR